ncbi:MAG: thioredoxin family protein [bacterium]|nr:thioredoxin family protein [bacterium]
MKNVIATLICLACVAAAGLVPVAEVSPNLQDRDYDIGQDAPTPEGKAETLVVFSATWCGPCQQMKPLWKKLKDQGYRIHQVDIDRPDPKIPAKYRSHRPRSVPTIQWWRHGDDKPIKTHVGKITEKRVKELLWKP